MSGPLPPPRRSVLKSLSTFYLIAAQVVLGFTAIGATFSAPSPCSTDPTASAALTALIGAICLATAVRLSESL